MGDYIDKIASRAGKTKAPPGEEGEGADVVVEVEGGGESSALDDLAQILDVPPVARKAFKRALTDLVKECMSAGEETETETSPGTEE